MKTGLYIIVLIASVAVGFIHSASKRDVNCGKFYIHHGDGSYSYTVINDIDSLNMEHNYSINIWIDGHEMTLKAPYIRVGRYKECK